MATKEPSPMPDAVIDGIFQWAGVRLERCPTCGHECAAEPRVRQAYAALRDAKWDSLNGCYFIHRYGMYIGIEIDGYMHT